jgi:hypothetical protein
MNALVDLDNAPGNAGNVKKQLEEAVKAVEDKPSKAPQNTDTGVPEKYQGKSLEDVIKMHQNAETRMGELGNEVGQYKTLTDKLLDLKRSEDLVKGGAAPDEVQPEYTPITQDDLLDNPTEAIGGAIKEALTQEARKQEEKDRQEAATAEATEFGNAHPDANAIVNSAEFQAWIQESPSRSILAQQAGAGSYASAGALLSEYKGLKANNSDDNGDTGESDNLQAARAASTESTGSSQAGDGPTGKKYRRLDLIRLQLEDPEAYADPAFQAEIMKAYAEKRVI